MCIIYTGAIITFYLNQFLNTNIFKMNLKCVGWRTINQILVFRYIIAYNNNRLNT